MMRFLNFYHCEHEGREAAGQEPTDWEDTSECTNNDKCPICHAEVEPHKSEDLQGGALPPDPEEMNQERAKAAQNALRAFMLDFGEEEAGITQNLTDLMVNFAHLCDREGLQFSEIIERAKRSYAEETNSQGVQF